MSVQVTERSRAGRPKTTRQASAVAIARTVSGRRATSASTAVVVVATTSSNALWLAVNAEPSGTARTPKDRPPARHVSGTASRMRTTAARPSHNLAPPWGSERWLSLFASPAVFCAWHLLLLCPLLFPPSLPCCSVLLFSPLLFPTVFSCCCFASPSFLPCCAESKTKVALTTSLVRESRALRCIILCGVGFCEGKFWGACRMRWARAQAIWVRTNNKQKKKKTQSVPTSCRVQMEQAIGSCL